MPSSPFDSIALFFTRVRLPLHSLINVYSADSRVQLLSYEILSEDLQLSISPLLGTAVGGGLYVALDHVNVPFTVPGPPPMVPTFTADYVTYRCADSCNGRGICFYGQCKCRRGFDGARCELIKCVPDATNVTCTPSNCNGTTANGTATNGTNGDNQGQQQGGVLLSRMDYEKEQRKQQASDDREVHTNSKNNNGKQNGDIWPKPKPKPKSDDEDDDEDDSKASKEWRLVTPSAAPTSIPIPTPTTAPTAAPISNCSCSSNRFGDACQSSYCLGSVTFTDTAGTIRDRYIGSAYLPASSCMFVIRPAAAVAASSSVTLQFDSFYLGHPLDYLAVFDGDSADSNALLAVLTGRTLPAPIRSRSSSMLLKFVSDSNSMGFDGFVAHYYSNTLCKPSIDGNGTSISCNEWCIDGMQCKCSNGQQVGSGST
jgi:hypothetical protein